jgi:predicted nucleic acid-binding protein
LLELAVAGNASAVVTGDADLLVLSPFCGIPVLRAEDFLFRFSGKRN